MTLKCKYSYAGNLGMPKRGHEVLPLGEEVKVLIFIGKEKKLDAEVVKIYDKNKSSIYEIVKEKQICDSVLLNLKAVKVAATVHCKCFR